VHARAEHTGRDQADARAEGEHSQRDGREGRAEVDEPVGEEGGNADASEIE
jgi:hypothetical protein